MPTPPKLPASPPATPDQQSPDRQYAWQVATNLWVSFRYAGQGLTYAFRTQRNFRIHTVISVVALTLGLALRLPAVQIAVLGLTCGAVLTLELINTALEAVVDLTVQQTYHELAKIAKDCAAAAVLVAAIAAVWVGGLLLVPPLWTLLFWTQK
ncbi:MAG: diacylglycerol kinase family protein [Leptolyngbya sp.]|nr:diacylglycerol kinase family protein [Leptolyngbya sp.]